MAPNNKKKILEFYKNKEGQFQYYLLLKYLIAKTLKVIYNVISFYV